MQGRRRLTSKKLFLLGPIIIIVAYVATIILERRAAVADSNTTMQEPSVHTIHSENRKSDISAKYLRDAKLTNTTSPITCRQCLKEGQCHEGLPMIPRIRIDVDRKKFAASECNGPVQGCCGCHSKDWGNVLSVYWAGRAMAILGGYSYHAVGRFHWDQTFMNHLPLGAMAPAAPNADAFQLSCTTCGSYVYFANGDCAAAWGNIQPTIQEDTRAALWEYSKSVPRQENDLIFRFFGPSDWLVYNRCCIFSHAKYAPGTLKIYDSIPNEGRFHVFIMAGSERKRSEDPYGFCHEIIAESIQYIRQRNPQVNVTVLQSASMYVDFSRLVFAPNVLVTSAGSSWSLWSTLANNGTVVTVPPSIDIDVSQLSLPPSYTILEDVELMVAPHTSERAANLYGIPHAKFSNSTKDRNAVMKFFRSGAAIDLMSSENQHRVPASASVVPFDGPLLFDRAAGWDGITHEEGQIFCTDQGSRHICPWNAYCQINQDLSMNLGILPDNTTSWAPTTMGQPVWVSIGGACRVNGVLEESEMANYIMCCRDSEDNVTVKSVGTEDEWNCEEECDIASGSTASITQKFCVARCKTKHHAEEVANVDEFFRELPNRTDPICFDECALLPEVPGSQLSPTLPSKSKSMCNVRCRWLHRMKAVSELAQKYDSSYSLDGHCDEMSKILHHRSFCSSVAHRQKTSVSLILRAEGLLDRFRLGLRDCAVSRCNVTAGHVHTNSSHLFVGAGEKFPVKIHAKQMNVNVLEANVTLAGSQRLGDWTVPYSELLMCNICDRYTEEVLTDTELSSWDRSVGIPTLEETCVSEIFSRMTVPSPKSLPLINPIFGIDAVFVTNYTPLKERREAVVQRIKDHLGIVPTVIADFDKEELSEHDMKCIGNTTGQKLYVGNVSAGQYSLTLKHFGIYYYMVEHNLDNVLVLEDDGNFINKDWTSSDSYWQQHIRALPEDYDILILCGEPGRFIKGERITDNLFLGQHSRATDMYMISQKGARNMLRSIPFLACISFQMNHATDKRGKKWWHARPEFTPRTIDMKTFHVEPPMSNQVGPNGTRAQSTYDLWLPKS